MPSVSYTRLIAVDPSLTASGWALFSLESGAPECWGVLAPPGAAHSLEYRLTCLQKSVADIFDRHALDERDVLVCEGPAPLVKNPLSSLKVERVRSIFEAVARARGVLVPGRLNPRTVQTELLGMRGKQLERKQVKAWAREVAVRLYGNVLNSAPRVSQDIIDALLIGSLAVSRVQLAARAGTSLSDAFSAYSKNGRAGAARGGRGRVRWSEADFSRALNEK